MKKIFATVAFLVCLTVEAASPAPETKQEILVFEWWVNDGTNGALSTDDGNTLTTDNGLILTQ